MGSYFHASLTDLGDEFTFTDGGYYERIENGTPHQSIVAGEFAGFKISEIPEVAASKSPEACAFAVLHNMANDVNHSPEPVTVHVYEFDREPDVDISDSVVGDFNLIEEVRYRGVSENPLLGQKSHQIDLPGSVLSDVDLAYVPPSPYIITEWAKEVKSEIRSVIDGGTYDPDGERPNPNAYNCY